MRLSPRYAATRFRHVDRMAMGYRLSELTAMEAKLKARVDMFNRVHDVLPGEWQDEYTFRVIRPAVRLLTIVQDAIPAAAARSINLRSTATRATQRRLGMLPDARRYARGF